MIMNTDNKRKLVGLSSSIVGRLIFYILMFSLLITIFGTGVQLYLDYNKDLDRIEKSLEKIDSIHLPAIIGSMWVTNDAHLELQLDGMLQTPSIKYLEIRNDTEILHVAGTPLSENVIEKIFPLNYSYNGKDVYLGELYIAASMQDIYERIFDHFLLILSFQAINIFLVSLFILIFFYRLVGRHIVSLSSFTESINFDSKYHEFKLIRKSRATKPDELEQLVSSINTMQKNLSLDISRREKTEEKLRRTEKIVSTSTDMLAFLDKDFIYLAANDSYVKELGKTSDEVIGYSVREVFGDDYFDNVIHEFAVRCLKGEMVNYQTWFNFPIKGRRYMDITYTPNYDAESIILGFAVCGRDITEQKQAEIEITEKSKALEKQFKKSEEQRIANLVILKDLNELTKNLKSEVTERKKTEGLLIQRMNELEIFNDATVDRELKINDMRKEVNELLVKLGRKTKYEVIK
mgnify:CR=1 FL=1